MIMINVTQSSSRSLDAVNGEKNSF